MTKSESRIQAEIRMAESLKGNTLWRNNRGAFQDKTGRWIRYGLLNESKQVGDKWKSADLIGIRPVLITEDMVGTVIGQFYSIEVKREGGKVHDGQTNWRDLVNHLGGYATIKDRADS